MKYRYLCHLLPATGLGQAFSIGLHYSTFVIQSLLQGTILSWRENRDNISLSHYYKSFNKGNILELSHIPQNKAPSSLAFTEVST